MAVKRSFFWKHFDVPVLVPDAKASGMSWAIFIEGRTFHFPLLLFSYVGLALSGAMLFNRPGEMGTPQAFTLSNTFVAWGSNKKTTGFEAGG